MEFVIKNGKNSISASSGYKLVGDAVPPLLSYKIIKNPEYLSNCDIIFTHIKQRIEYFNENAVKGLEPNVERINHNLNNSLMLVTALNPHIGYDKSAKVAKKAFRDKLTLREAIIELGYMSGVEFDKIIAKKDKEIIEIKFVGARLNH